MWELSQSLRLFVHAPATAPAHGEWLPQARRAVDPQLSPLLCALMPNPFWYPDFLSPSPGSRPRSLKTELRAVEAMSGNGIRAEIAATSDARPPAVLARILSRSDAGPVLAKALEAYWQQAVASDWPRIKRVLAADLAFRADELAAHGLHAMLNNVHRRIAYDGRVLSLDLPRHEGSRRVDADGLALVPCAFGTPEVLVVAAQPHPVTIGYPPRGVAALWHAPTPPVGTAPAALMGRNRAEILALVGRPMSSGEIAEQTRLTAAAVSRHLAVLRASGLVETRKSGRTTLSVRTSLGSDLLRAAV